MNSKRKKLADKLASVQIDDNPTFWLGKDPNLILDFAEKKVKGSKIVYKKDQHKVVIDRNEAVSLIGKEYITVQNCDDNLLGEIAIIQTIEKTKEKLGLLKTDCEFNDSASFNLREIK